jgi:hypothetical protein
MRVALDNGVGRFAAVDDNTNTVSVWALQQAAHKGHHDFQDGFQDRR